MTNNWLTRGLGWLNSLFNWQVSSRSMPTSVSTEKINRTQRFAQAWRAYEGDLDNPIRVEYGKPNDNILLNPCEAIVNKQLCWLFAGETQFICNLDDAEGERTYTETLKDVWAANGGMNFLHEVGLNAGVCGHGFIKMEINEGAEFPRLINLDPATVDVDTLPGDVDTVVSFTIEWAEPSAKNNGRKRRQVITRATTESWIILDQEQVGGTDGWANITEPLTWPYAFAPIFGIKNRPNPNKYWGRSDLSPHYVRAVNSRNFQVSNIGRINRFWAHPKTWASGLGTNQDIKFGVDDIAMLPANGQMGTIEQKSDMSGQMTFIQYMDHHLLMMAGVPALAFGQIDGALPVSGAAMRLHFQSLLESTKLKRERWSQTLDDLNSAILTVKFGESPSGSTYDCQCVWGDPLPLIPEEARTQLDMGVVSKRTISGKLGYDWEEESKQIEEEAKASMQQMQKPGRQGLLTPEEVASGFTGAQAGAGAQRRGAATPDNRIASNRARVGVR